MFSRLTSGDRSYFKAFPGVISSRWRRAFCCCFLLPLGCMGGAAFHVIAQRPDPAFALDGDLSDWSEVPHPLVFDRREQVHHGRDRWDSAADLGATVHLAWRSEGLYLAADVTDSQFHQTQRGSMMWKGDHLEIYIDAVPDADTQRLDLGQGQYQFGLSPGNFLRTGDALTDIPPEAAGFRPDNLDATDVKVAAARTSGGYALEALIPWSTMKVTPRKNLPIHIEIGVSDTDSLEPRQETYMTILTDRWRHKRDRLMPMLLGDAVGGAAPPPRRVAVRDALDMGHGVTETLSFSVPPIPEGKVALLTFRGRIAFSKPAGYAPVLELSLNDTHLEGARLRNRPMTSTYRFGRTMRFVTGEGLIALCYSPDFDAVDADQHYGLVDTKKACSYEFEITDLLKQGGNVIEFKTRPDKRDKWRFHFADIAVEFRAPPPPEAEPAPAPTGDIPLIRPRRPEARVYTLAASSDAALDVRVGGEAFRIASRFSTPDGQWQNGSCAFFTHSRKVEPGIEGITVFDTFTNRTDDVLPLMQRHECEVGSRLSRRWLAGLSPHTPDVSVSQPANPTCFAVTDRAGIGLMPMNDVFQVHALNYSLRNTIGLADNHFVLRPGSSYTAEWMVVPVPSTDFWDFVNAARRLRDVNFTLLNQFAFLSARKHEEAFLKRFVAHKTPDLVCASIGYPRYHGVYAHGTAFQHVDHRLYAEHNARMKALFPELQTSVYFHCFIDVIDGGEEVYAKDRILRPDGTHATYGRPHDKLFFPTMENTFGRDIGRNLDIIWNECGADGVYWDELEYSAYQYHYGDPWDGYSGDIEPGTHALKRLKSSVTLITQPWRIREVKRCLERGPFIANGQPHTRSMAALKFQRFVETASISNCLRAILYSPIALGDHISERTEVDAYRWMVNALNYGCVYNWYSERVATGYPTLAAVMFPITPLELHEGIIIGKERILTNRSGFFGWGDGASHEVHVFDRQGRQQAGHAAPTVTRDGCTYTELRIAEGWSAAIVRGR